MSDEETLVVHHHTGLGDHVICNGLVRAILDRDRPTRLWLITRTWNVANVQRLYVDDPRVRCIPVGSDLDVPQLPLAWDRVRYVRAGFEAMRVPDWDRAFYDSVGLPFDLSWNRFHVERDLLAERRLTAAIDPPREFALLHDVGSSGPVDVMPRTDLPVVRVRPHPAERTMFDWIGLIERAAEIHCINSSFIQLVDRLVPARPQRLHFYRAREDYRLYDGFERRRDWTVHE